jgi:hypothetical protein
MATREGSGKKDNCPVERGTGSNWINIAFVKNVAFFLENVAFVATIAFLRKYCFSSQMLLFVPNIMPIAADRHLASSKKN